MKLIYIIIFAAKVQQSFSALSIVIVLITNKNVKLMMEIGMNSIACWNSFHSIPTNRSVDGRNATRINGFIIRDLYPTYGLSVCYEYYFIFQHFISES